jgi:hypothetical protein
LYKKGKNDEIASPESRSPQIPEKLSDANEEIVYFRISVLIPRNLFSSAAKSKRLFLWKRSL